MRIKDKKMAGLGLSVVATTQPQFGHIHHVNHKHSLAVIKTRELYKQFFWSKNIKIIIFLQLSWSYPDPPNSSASFPLLIISFFFFDKILFFFYRRCHGRRFPLVWRTWVFLLSFPRNSVVTVSFVSSYGFYHFTYHRFDWEWCYYDLSAWRWKICSSLKTRQYLFVEEMGLLGSEVLLRLGYDPFLSTVKLLAVWRCHEQMFAH